MPLGLTTLAGEPDATIQDSDHGSRADSSISRCRARATSRVGRNLGRSALRALSCSLLGCAGDVKAPLQHSLAYCQALHSVLTADMPPCNGERHLAGHEQLPPEPTRLLLLGGVPESASSSCIECWRRLVKQQRVRDFVRQIAVLTCRAVGVVVDDHPVAPAKNR